MSPDAPETICLRPEPVASRAVLGRKEIATALSTERFDRGLELILDGVERRIERGAG
jgi:hypothetical protein